MYKKKTKKHNINSNIPLKTTCKQWQHSGAENIIECYKNDKASTKDMPQNVMINTMSEGEICKNNKK